MRLRFDRTALWVGLTVACTGSLVLAGVGQPSGTSAVEIDADDIGGTVTSAKGPEAGVWVIAETASLPTKFVKIVVTDDLGRYVVPDLPRGKYEVFVRGYGLVDSPRVAASPGQHLDLKAVVAPDGRVAAQVYPPSYWFSMLEIPQGKLSEQEAVSTVKECLQCHPLGNEGTRVLDKGAHPTSLAAWDERVKKGNQSLMFGAYQRLGEQRKVFADWTDRIAAGAYPQEAPPRPAGPERNVVISLWDWAWPQATRSDSQGTHDWDPDLNADGRVYGAHQNGNVLVYLDPLEHRVGEIETGVDGLRSIAMDRQGRVWVTGNMPQGMTAPEFCKPGSGNEFTEYSPLGGRGKVLVMYDPRTQEVTRIPSCMGIDHNFFGSEPDVPLYFGLNSQVGWVGTATWDRTKDVETSQGWCPGVIDSNGDGRIGEWTEPDQPFDPGKDRRAQFGCYSVAVSQGDGSLWCSGIGGNDNKLVRMVRGDNPPQSCQAEVYTPPKGATPYFRTGGVAVDPEGVAWLNWRGSDEVMSFDRRKCKVTSGPATATGEHCPEGWTVHRMSHARPTFQGTSIPRHAEMMYLSQIDRHDSLGLGSNAVVTGPVNSYSLQVLVPRTGQFLDLVVPYPKGFFSRSAQGRIDAPSGGWKGRGLWSNYSTYTPHFIEGGNGPKVVKFQVRPNPLAK